MCGISVYLNKKNKFNDLQYRLLRMNSVVKHRGPDDEGYFIMTNSYNTNCYGGDDTTVYNSVLSFEYLPKYNIKSRNNDSEIKLAMGFRRLSILDTSPAGHQPMSYKNGRYWIVFNGEIYNYVELKHELTQNGYNFQTNTDTEVIMAAYDCWETECFNKFNGMWALILFDHYKHELIVSRDRFGVKPLYYYDDGNSLLFASEIKQFIAFGDLDIKPNPEKIKFDLYFDTNEYSDETAFTNIFRFPNAHYWKINMNCEIEKKKQFIKYYQFEFNNDENNFDFDHNISSNLSEEYYQLLKDSVSLRLRSDVPIGTCFSGGMDSSSIVYLVNQSLQNYNKKELQKTFSLVFNSTNTNYCDESKYIRQLKNKLNIDSYEIEPKLKDIIDSYKTMVFAMDSPQHSSLVSYIFTYKLVKEKGVTVTLDGQGADEIQAGYISYYRYFFLNNSLNEIYHKFRNNYNIMKDSNNEIYYGSLFSIIRKLGLENQAEKYFRKNKMRSPFKCLNEALFEDLNHNLQTLFHYGDRGSMINSVESRFPMIDYRLVEFWSKMPSVYKIRNGFTKYIARKAFEGRLPDEIVWRKDKMGWELPQKIWLKEGLGKIMIKEILDSDFLKEIKLGQQPISADFSRLDNRGIKQLFRLYNLSLWHKIFFEDFNSQL